MIFTKPISEITYPDIVDFCGNQIAENVHLDYKEFIAPTLAKTIAAMANTWGGVIIFGVQDADGKPALPVQGIPFEAGVREQIFNIIISQMTPPVFPEIQVCLSPDNKRMLGVIRIMQSDIAPHALQANSRVYVRTSVANEPVENLVNLDQLAWMQDRRKKSVELVNFFHRQAHDRFHRVCPRMDSTPSLTLTAAPSFPYQMLIQPAEIRSALESAQVSGCDGHEFPQNLFNTPYVSVQNGIYSIFQNETYYAYEEANGYGFIFSQTPVGHLTGKTYLVFLRQILHEMDAFIACLVSFYEKVGYWGLIDVTISLDDLVLSGILLESTPDTVLVRSVFGGTDEGANKQPTDPTLDISKRVSLSDLKNGGADLLLDWFLELSWSLGFRTQDKESIRSILDKTGAATIKIKNESKSLSAT